MKYKAFPGLSLCKDIDQSCRNLRSMKGKASSMKLHEQLKLFSDAADGIRSDVSNGELKSLTENIKEHIDDIIAYLDIIEDDALALRAKAKAYSTAAKQQENKHERIKDYVKFALKSQGFTKFATELHKISLSTSQKAFAKRPPTKDDAWQMPELVKTDLEWKTPPTYEFAEDFPDMIEMIFSWDLDKLKTSGKIDLLDYETTDRLTIGVPKK